MTTDESMQVVDQITSAGPAVFSDFEERTDV